MATSSSSRSFYFSELYFFWALFSLCFFTNSSWLISEHLLRFYWSSDANALSWFFYISTSACRFWSYSSVRLLSPLWWIIYLSIKVLAISSFLFSVFSLFRKRFRSSRASLFPLIFIFISANSSPSSLMAKSLLAMFSVTSYHYSNNLCLSSCYYRNSSAVLSNSI